LSYGVLWTAVALFWANFVVTAFKRSAKEDKALKDKFGEYWMRWAERTRYRLFPGIF